jgi:hypothetical protein
MRMNVFEPAGQVSGGPKAGILTPFGAIERTDLAAVCKKREASQCWSLSEAGYRTRHVYTSTPQPQTDQPTRFSRTVESGILRHKATE